MTRLNLTVPWKEKPTSEEVEAFFLRIDAKLYATLNHIALSIVRDTHGAEDVVQECMLKLHDALQNRDLSGNVVPWLCRTVRNQAIDYRRRHGDGATGTGEHFDKLMAEPCLPPEERELAGLLVGFLQDMPPRQQRALAMRFLEERTLGDIAAILGCSERTARRLCEDGRSLLRKQMSAYCPAEKDFGENFPGIQLLIYLSVMVLMQ